MRVPDIPRCVAIVPEVAGTQLIAFWLDGESLIEQVYPVIAWQALRFNDESDVTLEPILYESFETVWCLHPRTGGYVFVEESAYETLDEAREEAMQKLKWQAEVKAKQAKPRSA